MQAKVRANDSDFASLYIDFDKDTNFGNRLGGFCLAALCRDVLGMLRYIGRRLRPTQITLTHRR